MIIGSVRFDLLEPEHRQVKSVSYIGRGDIDHCLKDLGDDRWIKKGKAQKLGT
jgi:hypothetical protein